MELLRETVEYRVTRNHLFTLGKLIKNMLANGWRMFYCFGNESGEYIGFVR